MGWIDRKEYRRFNPRVARRGRRVTMVVVVSLVAAAPALAFTQPWNPQPEQIVAQPGASPTGAVPSAPVSTTTTAPPAEQLSLLAVLRRPASALDHSQQVESALNQMFGGISGVETTYVRVLHAGAGEPLVVLVPAQSWVGPIRPDGSYASVTNPLCIDIVPPSGVGGGGSCEPASVLAAGHFIGSFGAFEYNVVPDGVARIVSHFADGSSLTAPVHDNFATFTGHASASGLAEPPTAVDWFDSSGSAVAQTK